MNEWMNEWMFNDTPAQKINLKTKTKKVFFFKIVQKMILTL